MKVFNVINPEAIEQLLDRDGVEVGRLLRRCLFHALQRDPNACLRLKKLPPAQYRPAWLTPERFARDADGHGFYWFSPPETVLEDIWLVSRWLVQALADNAPWLADTDETGLPRRLAHVPTLQQAVDMATIDSQQRARAMGENGNDLEGVYYLPDGWAWFRLKTSASLFFEGERMRNCLGKPQFAARQASGRALFYSLRDADSRSHVTAEVRGGVMVEAKAHGNASAERYAAALDTLRRHFGYRRWACVPSTEVLARVPAERAPLRSGAQSVRGVLDLSNHPGPLRLPEVMDVGGDLNLAGAGGLLGLPRILSVGGDLNLAGCVNLSVMPQVLWVRGTLDMRGCARPVRLAMAGCEVGGNLLLEGCTGLRRLPPHLRVGGSLVLPERSFLRHIPASVMVGESVFVGQVCFASVHEANRLLAQRPGGLLTRLAAE